MRRRTALALALLAAGIALTGYSGSAYARGWLAQERARAAWDARVARLAVEQGRRAGEGLDVTDPATGSPVARLVIPAIGLDDIVLEGVDDRTLNGGPGHLPGSAIPGDSGNAIVSAHRDRHFRKLGELRVGDRIVTYSGQDSVEWRISGRKVVSKWAPVLRSSRAPLLTLTTCWPIGYLGGAPDRLILHAVPLQS